MNPQQQLSPERLAEIEARLQKAESINRDVLGLMPFSRTAATVAQCFQDILDLLRALRSAYAEIERLHGLGLDKISQLGQEIEAYQRLGKLEGVMAEVKRVWADFDGTQSMSPDAYLVVNRIGEALAKAKDQDQEPVPDQGEDDLPAGQIQN